MLVLAEMSAGVTSMWPLHMAWTSSEHEAELQKVTVWRKRASQVKLHLFHDPTLHHFWLIHWSEVSWVLPTFKEKETQPPQPGGRRAVSYSNNWRMWCLRLWPFGKTESDTPSFSKIEQSLTLIWVPDVLLSMTFACKAQTQTQTLFCLSFHVLPEFSLLLQGSDTAGPYHQVQRPTTLWWEWGMSLFSE